MQLYSYTHAVCKFKYMVSYTASYSELTFTSKRQWVPRRPLQISQLAGGGRQKNFSALDPVPSKPWTKSPPLCVCNPRLTNISRFSVWAFRNVPLRIFIRCDCSPLRTRAPLNCPAIIWVWRSRILGRTHAARPTLHVRTLACNSKTDLDNFTSKVDQFFLRPWPNIVQKFTKICRLRILFF